MDDGLYNAFTNVFAALFGGKPDQMNNFHSGFRYTDGCGNDVGWTADFALPILHNGTDPHLNESSINFIRWSTLRFARDMGFGVMYHGYGDLPAIAATGSADYRYSAYMADIATWSSYVHNQLGITPSVFTTPDGVNELMSIQTSDNNYHAVFNESGFWATTGRKTPSILGGVSKPLNLHPGLPVDTLTQSYFTEPNYYPCHYHFTGATSSEETVDAIKSYVVEMHTASGYYAKTFFTHDISYNSSDYSGGGMSFSEFFDLMTWLDTNYGKTSGLDEMLFASAQTVLEYTYCRLNTTVNTYQNGKNITLEIIPPANAMRRPALTFKFNSSVPVQNINIYNINRFSQNISGATSGIINVEWSDEFYAAADRFVTTFESTKSQYDKDYAQYATDLITVPSLKIALQTRINAVTVITQITWLFDFGPATTGNQSDYPYNNVTASISGTLLNPATYSNLIKDVNVGTTMILYIGSNFKMDTSANYPGNSGLTANSGYFRDTALKDYYYVSSGSIGIMTFTGLDNNKKYDFNALPNRSTNTNYTKYNIYNDTLSFTYSSTVASKDNFFTASNIINAIPVNNTLYLRIAGSGSSTAYINGLKIVEHD